MEVMQDDIAAIDEALTANGQEARRLVSGLGETLGAWRRDQGSWSVAECLDHLATANTVYLRAMRPPAERALARRRTRRRPAVPGLVGGWFVRYLEPPVKPRLTSKAPKSIRPRESPPLHDAMN